MIVAGTPAPHRYEPLFRVVDASRRADQKMIPLIVSAGLLDDFDGDPGDFATIAMNCGAWPGP